MAHTENEIRIDAPLDLVWERTNDVAGWPHLFTEYAKAEVLAKEGDKIRFRLTMHPDDQGRVWSWVSERTMDPDNRTVVARRVEPGPFKYMDIRWTYREDEGGGVVMRWEQDFEMRPDAPLNDEAMTERINANTLIQMEAIKQRLEAEAANGRAT